MDCNHKWIRRVALARDRTVHYRDDGATYMLPTGENPDHFLSDIYPYRAPTDDSCPIHTPFAEKQ